MWLLKKHSMMKQVPKILILSRLGIGIVLVALSLMHISNYNIIAVILFTIGLLTDIFDGIIARRLNISTQTLRRMDSTVDQVFFILVAIATFIESSVFFHDNYIKLIILVAVEAATYLICFIKFKKEVATHSIGAKVWTLVLFATIIQIMLTLNSNVLFGICFYLGIATRLEIIAILLIIPNWTNDIPNVYQALRLRKGKPVKRHKLFNG
jgi:phosphatidylglycerophosphate synthase